MVDTYAGASRLLSSLPGRSGFGDASLIRHRAGSLDLGGGNPDPAVLPVALYRDAVGDLTSAPGFAASLRYVPAPGIPALRSWLGERDGVPSSRVIITVGGAQGLALAVLATLDDGDTIIVDDPVYPLFLRVLDLLDVRVIPARVDDAGIDVDELTTQLRSGLRPKALFTVPTFQNPTGATLTAGRETQLAELAERYGFTIIFDDPYRDLPFEPRTSPSRSRLLNTERVVAVNSFSKTLGPALRLGWNVVPDHLTEQYIKLRNRLDGQTSGVLQEIALRIVQRPEYVVSLADAGAHYAKKAAALGSALQARFGHDIRLTEPHGGYFLWAQLTDRGADFDKLHDLAQEEGVFYQRGEWFAAGTEQRFTGYLRLSFSELTSTQLEEAADRLHRAWLRARH